MFCASRIAMRSPYSVWLMTTAKTLPELKTTSFSSRPAALSKAFNGMSTRSRMKLYKKAAALPGFRRRIKLGYSAPRTTGKSPFSHFIKDNYAKVHGTPSERFAKLANLYRKLKN